MALPSARRPKEVEEELKEEMKVVQREKIVVLTSSEIFLRAMTRWYEELSEKKKRELTPVVFKRKALSLCYAKKIVYDRLPRDWVQQLKDRCGGNFRLYKRKKKDVSEKKVEIKYESRSARLSGKLANVVFIKEEPQEYIDGAAGFDTSIVAGNGIENLSLAPMEAEAGLSNGSFSNPQFNTFIKPAEKARKTNRIKKFVDLSGDPPPPRWMAAYARGNVLHRQLTVYSTDDSNILFYDYNPKLKDSFGKDIKVPPQPRHGWSEFIRE